MQAFHNDPKHKKFYLDRVKQHIKADEVVKRKYWQDGKGCAVGCTIHGSNHKDYAAYAAAAYADRTEVYDRLGEKLLKILKSLKAPRRVKARLK